MKKADIPELRTLRPEPKREFKTNKYLLPDPRTGQTLAWHRATSLAGLHEDHGGIDKWKLRTVLEGVCYDLDRVSTRVPALVDTIDNASDWREASPAKKELDKIAESLHDLAGGNDGNRWGTLLHTITEWADAGRLDEVLPEIESWGETGKSLLADLEAYQKAMTEAGLICSPEYVERIVVNSTVGSGGTFDRLIRLSDGRLVVGDVKTQKSMGFGAILHIAAQLSEYANADAMLASDGTALEPMPEELDRNHAIIMWIPVGSADCKLIELGPQEMQYGWDLAQHAAETLRWREIASSVRGRPFDPTTSVINPAGLLSEITHAESPEHLASIWSRYPKAVRAQIWTDEHTAAAVSRKAELRRLR